MLEGRYYRKVDIYEMLWDDVNLAHHKVAAAHYGGPIAMVKDPRAALLHAYSSSSVSSASSSANDNKLRIFTSSGSLLSTVAWEHRGLVDMAWNSQEQLVCVFDSGEIVCYSLHGERVSSIQLPPACKQDGVAAAVMWLDGLVVRTSNSNELYAILNYHEPRVVKLADTGLPTPPTSMCVMGGQRVTEIEVFVSTADGSLIVVDRKEAEDQLLDIGPFVLSSISQSGALLAAFNDKGTLHILSTDLKRNVCRLDIGGKIPPSQLVWCQDMAVVLHWEGMLLLVGLQGEYIKYSYDSPLLLCAEADGVRVITNTSHEWLHVVDGSMEQVFRVGSTHPAARLFDAHEAFEQQHGNAAEYLRLIEEEDKREEEKEEAKATSAKKQPKPALRSAIDACLTAAAHEFSPPSQQQLLKAAAYGKLFASNYPADKFVDMCRILRVLNAIRHPSIGIPLTYTQYLELEAERVIDRLTARHEYLLAIRLCQYLKMEVDKVIVHWACTKIAASEDDEASERLSDEKLGEMIISKLMMVPGISFAPIATTAFRYGRRALATMVLEYEPLADNQVPLLLSMKEDELALDKAIASGDTDLVYMCILHMLKARQQKDFFALIRDRPLARQLYIAYCRQTDLNGLKAFYYFLQHPVDAANVAVLQAYSAPVYKDRVQLLRLALEFYEKDKSSSFMAKATEEQLRLLELEREQEMSTAAANPADSCVDEPLSYLLKLYILSGDKKKIGKLQKQFNVSDTRLWHSQVKAFASAGQWEELQRLATESKKAPPIGFLPFVEACVEQKEYTEAVKYIERLSEHRVQIEWLCAIGYWTEAADVAAKARDVEALQVIRQSCRNQQALTHISELMDKLRGA